MRFVKPILIGQSGNVQIWTGTSSPESVVSAPISSIYLQSDGSTGTSFWVKESGTGSTGWSAYGAPRDTHLFSYPGTLVTATGTSLFYNRTGRARSIIGVWASVGTAPTGSSILVDVNKNGTTLFTTQANRPAIAVSTTGGVLATPAVTSLADGDYLTVDIDQVGSTVAGANLTVGVVVA